MEKFLMLAGDYNPFDNFNNVLEDQKQNLIGTGMILAVVAIMILGIAIMVVGREKRQAIKDHAFYIALGIIALVVAPSFVAWIQSLFTKH